MTDSVLRYCATGVWIF